MSELQNNDNQLDQPIGDIALTENFLAQCNVVMAGINRDLANFNHSIVEFSRILDEYNRVMATSINATAPRPNTASCYRPCAPPAGTRSVLWFYGTELVLGPQKYWCCFFCKC